MSDKNIQIKSQDISVEEIETMSYVEFISFIEEINRPPGGLTTVYQWIQNCFINKDDLLLEVGSNTGFTSVEIARITKCNIIGIELVEDAIQVARNWVKQENLCNVDFLSGNVEKLVFDNEHFTKIICGGALSFVENRRKAIKECWRVLKNGGMLGASPFYYTQKPPKALIDQLSFILSSKIELWDQSYWLNLFSENGFEIYFQKDFSAPTTSKEQIEQYANNVVECNLNNLSNTKKEVVKKRIANIMLLFNENHNYLGYSVICMRKNTNNKEITLFG
jgi:ubiquinone/menaquinone biosynthesis C-methylase UbiE